MYRGFVFAQDAIADFVRSLHTADKVAFYSSTAAISTAPPLLLPIGPSLCAVCAPASLATMPLSITACS